MAAVCAATQARELVLASGEVLKSTNTSLVLAHSAADVANLLGAGGLRAPGGGSVLAAGR